MGSASPPGASRRRAKSVQETAYGRFYWYVPVWVAADAAFSIGVAVA